jgi:hypothetical protein
MLKIYESDYTDASNVINRTTIVIRSKILYELRELFDRLKNPQIGCTIDRIIIYGPEEYKSGRGSKDCV